MLYIATYTFLQFFGTALKPVICAPQPARHNGDYAQIGLLHTVIHYSTFQVPHGRDDHRLSPQNGI